MVFLMLFSKLLSNNGEDAEKKYNDFENKLFFLFSLKQYSFFR